MKKIALLLSLIFRRQDKKTPLVLPSRITLDMATKNTSSKKPLISTAASEQLQRMGVNISLARRARGWSQTEMANQCGMGLSTLISIEKGEPVVGMSHWLNALETVSLEGGLEKVARLEGDPVTMRVMADLVPKRASPSMRRR